MQWLTRWKFDMQNPFAESKLGLIIAGFIALTFFALFVIFGIEATAPMPEEPRVVEKHQLGPFVRVTSRPAPQPEPTPPPPPKLEPLGFILLMNEYGTPVLYEAVKGRPEYSEHQVAYTNTEGTFRRWSGNYLYSTAPIRLRTEPLIPTMTGAQFREH